MQKIPLTIVNGFLGAGKTTLLKHLLGQAKQQQLDLAAIVNDISSLEVDGVLVANNEPQSPAARQLVSIFGDDIASPSGLARLDQALQQLGRQQPPPQHILLETSGGSHPLPLVRHLQNHPRVALKGVLVVIDPVMLRDDYGYGQQLLPRLQANLQSGRRDTTNLVAEQILFSTQLVLSRADRLPPDTIERIARAIHPLHPGVPIAAAVRGNLRLDALLQQPDYDFHRVARLVDELQEAVDATHHQAHAHALDYRVVRDPRPFHPQRLWELCQQQLGTGIHRSKGFFWLPSRDDLALLWNQASGSISLEVISYWKAGALSHSDNRLTREERQALQQQVHAMHPVFGDRRCELTIIGAPEQLDAFVAALRSCFLTPAEIRAWQAGEPFDDPWPHRTVRIDTP